MILERLKKLWALSGLDSAHLEDLLKRASDDAKEQIEIPIRGDGNKKNYRVAEENVVFIPRHKRDPVKELLSEETNAN